jgi:hypothetical protein
MTELGYDRFASHGGDWGSAVTSALGMHHAERMLAVHFTMVSPPIDPDALSPDHPGSVICYACIRPRTC